MRSGAADPPLQSLFISADLEALNKPLVTVGVGQQEVKEVLEAASPIHFRVLLADQLLGAAHLLMHGEAMDAGDRNPRLVRIEDGPMDEGLELTIAQNFQVVSDVDMEGPRDSGDSRPRDVVMVHHFKPRGALQKDGDEAIVGMGTQSDVVTSVCELWILVQG